MTKVAPIDVAGLAKAALREFSISRYSQVASLTFRDWWPLVELRREILECLSQGLWLSPVECAAIIRRVSEGPLVTMGEGLRAGSPAVAEATLEDLRRSSVLAEAYLNEQSLALTVTAELSTRKSYLEMKFVDAGALSGADEEEYFTVCSEVRRLEDLSATPFSAALADAIAAHGDKEGVSPRWLLSLDTSAPDQILVNDFRAWLKAHRQAVGRQEGLSAADLRKWAQHRVLPYIDLRLLTQLAGDADIATNAWMGNRLFSDLADVDVAEKVRKTTAPIAEWLLGDGQPVLLARARAEVLELTGNK
ncbi:DUF6387 family protein [Luteimonas sp. A611]